MPNKTTLQISEPSSPEQREKLLQVLGPCQKVYRKGTDPCLYVDMHPWENPRLKVVQLNQLEGVRAQVYGESPMP